MTAASTPGPWKAHFEEAHFVIGPDLGRVAMMMNLKGAHGLGGRRSGAESAANCRLIAAAPDLVTPLTRKMVRFSNWLLWAIGGTVLVHVSFYKLLRVPLPWGPITPFY